MIDQYLEKKNSTFRTPVLAVAVGIYLPFELSVPILAGGLISHFVKKYFKPKFEINFTITEQRWVDWIQIQ